MAAQTLHGMALGHLTHKKETETRELHRILVYDCPPLEKRVQQPVSGHEKNFAKTDLAIFRKNFHQALREQRKVALRLGELADNEGWTLKSKHTKPLIKGTLTPDALTDDHFTYNTGQKGVDMKIALDITRLSLKGQVDQIVLIAGDADFVPAAKQARREGVDFVLDPMWASIRPSLNEHIDGKRSVNLKGGGPATEP